MSVLQLYCSATTTTIQQIYRTNVQPQQTSDKERGKTPMRNNILGERLKSARVKAGQTQEDIAKLLRVQRQVISYFENGSRTPNIDDLIMLAEIFGTSTDYLLGLTDAQSTDPEVKTVCNYTGLSEAAVGTLSSAASFLSTWRDSRAGAGETVPAGASGLRCLCEAYLKCADELICNEIQKIAPVLLDIDARSHSLANAFEACSADCVESEACFSSGSLSAEEFCTSVLENDKVREAEQGYKLLKGERFELSEVLNAFATRECVGLAEVEAARAGYLTTRENALRVLLKEGADNGNDN